MSIYNDGGQGFEFPTISIDFKKLKYPLIAIVAIFVVITLLFSLNEVLKPKPLELSLHPNPLDLTSDNSSSLLDVKIFNTAPGNVSYVVVAVEEIGSSNLIVFPPTRAIESMAPQTSRELKPFVIRPDPSKEINSGSYKLKVTLTIDGEKIDEMELTLVLKAV